jgi:uncharacterized protein (TIGR00661 family)
MAKIFYSMAGEGRGHATRVRTLVEDLRKRHELILLAPGDAYELLEGAYRGSEVRVERLPGLRFVYDARQRVHYPRTLARSVEYLRGLPELKRQLGQRFERERADLLITDYDPGAPRAAEAVGLPYMAVDHQSLFNFGDLSFLPRGLRLRAAGIARFNRLYYQRQVHTVSSSFFKPEPKPGVHNVTFVGTLLRPALLAAKVEAGAHAVAYCRRSMPSNVLEALAGLPIEVRVYGLGEAADRGNLRFRAISEQGFIADLCSARCVIGTAGNQLIGEALYLGKPVFALPEAGQYEQEVNGHLLERMGGGTFLAPEALRREPLQRFLSELPRYAGTVDREFAAGNRRALEAIEAVLSGLPAAVSV